MKGWHGALRRARLPAWRVRRPLRPARAAAPPPRSRPRARRGTAPPPLRPPPRAPRPPRRAVLSFRWSGEPPLLYVEHAGEQLQAPLGGTRGAAPLELPFVPSQSVDVMVGPPRAAPASRGGGGGAAPAAPPAPRGRWAGRSPPRAPTPPPRPPPAQAFGPLCAHKECGFLAGSTVSVEQARGAAPPRRLAARMQRPATRAGAPPGRAQGPRPRPRPGTPPRAARAGLPTQPPPPPRRCCSCRAASGRSGSLTRPARCAGACACTLS